jgi:hypothetical protein
MHLLATTATNLDSAEPVRALAPRGAAQAFSVQASVSLQVFALMSADRLGRNRQS